MTNDEKRVFFIVFGIVGAIIALIVVAALVGEKYEYDNYNKEYSKMYEEISYTVPKELKDSEYSNIKDHRYSYFEDDCYVSFNVEADDKEYYDNTEEYLKKSIYTSIDNKVSEVEEIEMNGEKFYSVNIKEKKSGTIEYYYALESTNYYYLLRYRLVDDSNGDVAGIEDSICYTAKDQILKTIHTKH